MRYIYGVSQILRIGLLWAKTTDGWNKLFSNLVPRFSPLYLAREAKKREKKRDSEEFDRNITLWRHVTFAFDSNEIDEKISMSTRLKRDVKLTWINNNYLIFDSWTFGASPVCIHRTSASLCSPRTCLTGDLGTGCTGASLLWSSGLRWLFRWFTCGTCSILFLAVL